MRPGAVVHRLGHCCCENHRRLTYHVAMQVTGQGARRGSTFYYYFLRVWLALNARTIALIVAPAFCLWSPGAVAQHGPIDKLLRLATGPEGGAFRPVGTSLCDWVNRFRSETSIRCVPQGTAGSIFNLQAVEQGSVQLGLAQEDLLDQHFHRSEEPRGSRLRVVAALHTSPIAVLVRPSAGGDPWQAIRRLRVNVGNRGSGQHTISLAILDGLKVPLSSIQQVTYAPTHQFESLFCGNQVDMVLEAVAHPSPLFERLLSCGGEMIDLPQDVMDHMRRVNPFLAPMEIPAGTYPNQERGIRTLGMRNILFTNSEIDPVAIERLMSTLAAGQVALVRDQTLLRSLAPNAFKDVGIFTVPVHEGVRRALRRGTP